MVSQTDLRNAQQQIQSASFKLKQQKKQIEEARNKLIPTKRELLSRNIQQQVGARSFKRKSNEEINKAEKFLAKREIKIVEAKKEVKSVQESINNYNEALRATDAFSRGATFARLGLNSTQAEIFDKIIKRQVAFRNKTKSIKELGDGNFKKGIGKLKKIEELKREFGDLKEIKIEDLKPDEFSRFEKAGLIVSTPSSKKITKNIRGGEVQKFERTLFEKIKDIPSSTFEKVTGRTPKEALIHITGSKRTPQDINLITGTSELFQAPLRSLQIPGAFGQIGVEKVLKKFPEFKGVKTKDKIIGGDKFLVPQFGTVIKKEGVPFGFDEITTERKFIRGKTIFEPKRIAEGVNMGIQLGIISRAPLLLFSPGIFAEGTETAFDKNLSTGKRIFGVIEAELGLLGTGVAIKQLTKGLNPIKINEISEINKVLESELPSGGGIGKKARTGKQKISQEQIQKAKAKTKTKTKAEITPKEFLEIKLTTKGKNKEIEFLSKESGKFSDKSEKINELLKLAKTKEQKLSVLKLAKESYGNKFLKEFVSQEFGVIPKVGNKKFIGNIIKDSKKAKAGEINKAFGEESIFKGKGIYERTSGKLISNRLNKLTNKLIAVDSQLNSQDISQFKTSSLLSKQDLLTKQASSNIQLSVSSLTNQLQSLKTRQDLLTKQLQSSLSSIAQDTMQKQQQKQIQKQISSLNFQQAQLQRKLSFREGLSNKIGSKKNVIKNKIYPFNIDFDKDKIKKMSQLKLRKKTDGVIVEIKERGKYKSFTRPFKNEQQAINFARNIIDNSTSARFRLKRAIKVKEFSKVRAPGVPSLKFRDYKIVNGKRIGLKNFGEIERRKRRIDTKGEKEGLKAAKLIKQRFGNKINKINFKNSLGSKITIKPKKQFF